jgi:hypothetical protein
MTSVCAAQWASAQENPAYRSTRPSPRRSLHGQLVEAGCHGAVLFEQVDAALHGVALLVRFLVERRRPAAPGAALAPVGGLVVLDRDDAPDPAAEIGPVALRAVGLITQDPVWPGPGPATIRAGYPDALQHGGELRAVPGAARR